MNAIAGELRRLRERLSLSQEELAERANVSTRTISDIERGLVSCPQARTVRLLADGLELTRSQRASFFAAARPPDADAEVERPVPQMLLRDIASFTGREAELRQLVDAASRTSDTAGVVGIYVVEGMGGVGKTALALRVAHQIKANFPGGQLFIDLHGYTPGVTSLTPGDALSSLLIALGASPGQIPEGLAERAASYRTQLAGTRTLIILDNAASPDQVEPLLPGTAGCLVIITSRRALSVLDDAHAVPLDALPPEEAIRLFCAVAGPGRADQEDPQLAEIAELCGYLPLAIRILAARLKRRRSLGVGDVLAELRREHRHLAQLADGNHNVAAAIELSFRHLPETAQRMFEHLGLIPGPDFDVCAATNIVADADTVGANLDSLLDHNLLIQHATGRYRFHDLVREFARMKSEALGQDGLDRLLDFYLYSAQEADRRLPWRSRGATAHLSVSEPRAVPDLASTVQAQRWITSELPNLESALRLAYSLDRFAYTVALSGALAEYLRVNGPWDAAIRLHRLALDAATQTSDLAGQIGTRTHIGIIERQAGRLSDAVGTLSRTASDCRAAGMHLELAGALVALGITHRVTGEPGQASESLVEALSIYRAGDDRYGQAETLRELGEVQRQTGIFGAAEQSLTEARTLFGELGHRYGEASTLSYLGCVRLAVKAYEPACDALSEALDIYRALDDPICQANCLLFLGKANVDQGALEIAEYALIEAGVIYGRLGDRRGQAGVLTFLGDTQRLAGRHEQAGHSLALALNLFREVRDPGGEAEAGNLHAALALAAGDPAEARRRNVRALRVAHKIPSPRDKADALEGMANSHRAEGTTATARRLYAKALTLYESMGCDADAARVRAALNTLARSPVAPE